MIEIIDRLLKNGQFEPYIKFIRFPHFRNLEADTKIDFEFPLTVLVGQNGTNKSSVLRALYGCPGNNSIGKFWFSTKVDPIAESGQRPRIIYGYYQPDAKREVEILKTRVRRVFKRTVKGVTRDRVDPDYWEPSRPILNLGMEKMPAFVGSYKGRSKTRWNAIEKEVVFIDFRSEISAFDKYFYHGNLKTTLTQANKQDVIRRSSKNLKNIIDKDLSSLVLYNKNVVRHNLSLTAEMIIEVSNILGREYSGIKLIQHSLFKTEGYSAVLKHGSIGYSEAWAGSGEFAIVKLVYSVMSAEPKSLIILDEPEVSLHPGAQTRLTKFLLNRIKIDKHQIVLGTHSPFIIKGLPPQAIKTMSLIPFKGKVHVQHQTLPDQAFFHLGVPQTNRIQLLTEDLLASKLVAKCLRLLGQPLAERFELICLPGGAASILHYYIPVFARTKPRDVLVVLDGDQRLETVIPGNAELLRLEIEEIEAWVKRLAVQGMPSFPIDGGVDGGDANQLKEAYLDYLNFGRENMAYLPKANPEEFLWEIGHLGNDYPELGTIEDIKERFVELTKNDLGKADYENVTAVEILATQERLIAKIPDDNQDLLLLLDFFKKCCKRG